MQPQSGTFVRALSAEEVRELAELRLVLEAHATAEAARKIGADELAELRRAFRALSARGAGDNFEAFLALDDLFHTTVHRAAENRRIAEILRNLRDQIHWVRVSTAVLPGRVDESLSEMWRILEALERRDGEAAAREMRRHIGNIADSYRSMQSAGEDAA